MLSSVINVLAGGVGGFEGGEEGNGTEITNNLFSTDNYNAFDELKNSTTYPDYPRAYLNYVVFDDEFNLVREESGAIQVSGNNNSWQYMSLPSELTMSRNGYIALYLSNEEALPVFFDNLIITQHQGRLLEEQHYYPHGLLVNKSVAAGTNPVNKYQFQGNVMQDLVGMQLYDFHARQYDPQIGRFTAVDPLADYSQESLSPYHFCHNNPVNFVDPLGLIDGRMVFDAARKMLYGGELEEFTLTAQADHPSTVHVDHTNGGGGAGFGGSHSAPSGWNSSHGGGSGGPTGSHGSSSGHSNSGSNGRITPTVSKTPPLKQKLDLKDYGSQRSEMMRKIEPKAAEPLDVSMEVLNATALAAQANQASIELGVGKSSEAIEAAIGKAGLNYVKGLKGLGLVANVLSVGTAAYQVYENPTVGNFTRLGVQGLAIGFAFVPVVGWALSIGITVWDMGYGEEVYDSLDKP